MNIDFVTQPTFTGSIDVTYFGTIGDYIDIEFFGVISSLDSPDQIPVTGTIRAVRDE